MAVTDVTTRWRKAMAAFRSEYNPPQDPARKRRLPTQGDVEVLATWVEEEEAHRDQADEYAAKTDAAIRDMVPGTYLTRDGTRAVRITDYGHADVSTITTARGQDDVTV